MRILRLAIAAAFTSFVAMTSAACTGTGTPNSTPSPWYSVQAAQPDLVQLTVQRLGYIPDTHACMVLRESGSEQLAVQAGHTSYVEVPSSTSNALEGTACDFVDPRRDAENYATYESYVHVAVYLVPNWSQLFQGGFNRILNEQTPADPQLPSNFYVTTPFKVGNDSGWLITQKRWASQGDYEVLFKEGNYAVDLDFLNVMPPAKLMGVINNIRAAVQHLDPKSKF